MLNHLLSAGITWIILKLIVTICLAIIANTFFRSLVTIPHKLETKRAKTYAMVIKNAITLVIFVVTVHVIFIILGINIAPLLASAGIVGIAVGIGARSLFEDLIAGFFLISQTTIAVGDYIVINSTTEGTIRAIGFKNLTLHSPNGSLTIIPNGQIKQITNTSFGKATMILQIPVSPKNNIDTVLSVCKDVLKTFKEDDEEFPLSDDSDVLGVSDITNPPAVMIMVKLVSKNEMRGVIDNEYRYRLLKAFEKRKIAIN